MRKKYNLQDGQVVAVRKEDAAQVELFCNPTEGEKKYLMEHLKIDEHTLASALDPDELSRLEFEPAHKVILFNRPKAYAPTMRRKLGIGRRDCFFTATTR